MKGNPRRQAELLADLAAAHLLLAEQLQAPLEVAAALEAVVHALELDPGNPVAQFNRRLALDLLAISGNPSAPPGGNPWIDELQLRSMPPEQETFGDRECPSASGFRAVFDAWAEAPSAETWSPVALARDCWDRTADRFYADLLGRAAAEPEATARAWTTYTSAEATLFSFQIEAAERRLKALDSMRISTPVALAARRLKAIIAYQRSDYPRAVATLTPLAQAATAAGFFRLAGETHRLLALIAQVRGEIREAFYQLDLAATAAKKARSPMLDAALASLRIEILRKVGREDEAWRGVLETLRGSVGQGHEVFELTALRVGAMLAQDRSLGRVALMLYDRGVELSETLGPGPEVSSLRLRGELLADLDKPALARADFDLAKRLLLNGQIANPIAETLSSDLLLLEGRTADKVEARRTALEKLVASYRAADYDLRLLAAENALAQLQRDQGDFGGSIATLERALGDLNDQLTRTSQWSDVPALVAAARPLAEDLVSLDLHHRSVDDLREDLATSFGLRFGTAKRRDDETLGADQERLTTFVLEKETLLFLEVDGEYHIERRPVGRKRLAELRERMLLQLRNQVGEDRLAATSAELGELLLSPVANLVFPGRTLTIVADDVLAGLPFQLLPIGTDGELLIDRIPIRYSFRWRKPPDWRPPEAILVVGVSSAPVGLQPLPEATAEAREVASLFPDAALLLDPDAQMLSQAIAEAESAHLAGHFLPNTRSPLDSYLFLTTSGGTGSGLSLRELIGGGRSRLRLLYLSACDTGRGLPPSAHGLASLAQAFAETGVEQTVIALWPLDDRTGHDIAVRFYRLLRSGATPALSLRTAQLAHRYEHPSLWGSLALFE